MLMSLFHGHISWPSMISYVDLDGNSTDRGLQIMSESMTRISLHPLLSHPPGSILQIRMRLHSLIAANLAAYLY
jgi:hypothetical protein